MARLAAAGSLVGIVMYRDSGFIHHPMPMPMQLGFVCSVTYTYKYSYGVRLCYLQMRVVIRMSLQQEAGCMRG